MWQELERVAEAHNNKSSSGGQKAEAEAEVEEEQEEVEELNVRLEEDLNNACSIACGSAHVAVATDNGAVYTYGSGRLGQLGHGNKRDLEVPQVVEALRQRHVIMVACGRDHTVAATAEGEVYFWGNRVDSAGWGSVTAPEVLPVQVERLNGLHIRQIACGDYHTAVLTDKGDVYVWGQYQANKLCPKCNHEQPYLISATIEGKIVSIACGPHQTIAVTQDHRVWAWGSGVLKTPTNGHEDLHRFHLPTPIEAFDGYKVVQVACGDFNVMGLTVHGEVVIAHDLDFFKKTRKFVAKSVGYGMFYGLGTYDDVPLEVNDSKPHRIVSNIVKQLFWIRFLQIAVYKNTAMGVTGFGEAYTWTLPDPWRDFTNEIKPVKLEALTDTLVAQVACGGERTAILVDERTFLASHLHRSLNSPQFADIQIVAEGRPILAHKCILAARCKYWQVLMSLPPDELGGFQWDHADPDGLQTLILPTDDVFSYSVVLALLQYLYTDKLIAPTEFGLPQRVHSKNKAKQSNAQTEEEEEEATKANRRAWYKQLGKAAKYFQITRLRRLCQRATRKRGFDVEVPSSSLASDLLWLVEPQIQAFGNHDIDSGADVPVPAAETEKLKRLAEIEQAVKKINDDYAEGLKSAHELFVAQMQKALTIHESELSEYAVKLRREHVKQVKERAEADARACAERDTEANELEAKERSARERESERLQEARRQQQQDETSVEFLTGDLESQMVQNRCADVKFTIGGVHMWAHKLIIASSCEYFRLMFTSGMRESELGEVDLGEEVEPGVFAHLLAFLYTDSLSGVDANTAIDLIAIADHFMLPRMKNICEIRIQKDVEVENVAYAPRLRTYCMGFMMRNFAAVQLTETFASLPPELAREVRDRVAGAPAPKKAPVGKGQQQQQQQPKKKKKASPRDHLAVDADAPVARPGPVHAPDIDADADAPVARPGPVLAPDDLAVLSLAADRSAQHHQRHARPSPGGKHCVLS